MVAGEIPDVGDADLVLLRRFLDGGDERQGVGGGRDLPDDQIPAFDVDFGPENDPAVAVVVLPDIHHPALLEVGIEVELLALEFGDLRVQQFVEVVRQHAGGHAHRDAVAAHHQQTGHFGRKQHRFLFPPVVVGDEFGDVVVEHRRVGQTGQRTLGVPRGRRRTAGEDVAEVPLGGDEVRRAEVVQFLGAAPGVADHFFHTAALVGQHGERVGDGSVAVGVKMHRVAHHVGAFGHEPVVVDLVERPQNAPLDRFQAVVHVRDGPRADDVTGVFEEVPVHHPPEKVVAALPLFGQSDGIVLLVRLLRERRGGGQFVTHSRRPPDCS